VQPWQLAVSTWPQAIEETDRSEEEWSDSVQETNQSYTPFSNEPNSSVITNSYKAKKCVRNAPMFERIER
jgi:hypothetical protein